MVAHHVISDIELFQMIRHRHLVLAGNKRLKIYGKLNCVSGKRMKKVNRVFFKNEAEALLHGYRACKRCMSTQSKINLNEQETG